MRVLPLLLCLFSSTAAAAPGFIPIQGVLTDSTGTPIDGTVSVTFTLYSDGAGTTSLWTDTMDVTVTGGGFATSLGANLPLDLDTFSNFATAHLEIQVGTDTAMALVPLDHVPYAAHAEVAGSADTLEGLSLGDLRAEIPVTSDLEAAARDVAFDTEAELTALLDDNYLEDEAELTALLDDNYMAAGTLPAWGDLTGVPAGFSDGVDNDTQLSQATVEGYAEGVAYNTEAELTAVLNDNYVGASGGTAASLTTTGTLNTAAVRIGSNSDVAPGTFSGALVIGSSGNVNIGIDGNEIMARETDNGVATLNLQLNDGPTRIGGDLSVDGVISSSCPTDWHRAGSSCVSPRQTTPLNFNDALLACATAQTHMCSIREIQDCDLDQPSGADCTADTDADVSVWSSDLAPVTAAINGFTGGNALYYRGSGGSVSNQVAPVPKTLPLQYYCCTH